MLEAGSVFYELSFYLDLLHRLGDSRTVRQLRECASIRFVSVVKSPFIPGEIPSDALE